MFIARHSAEITRRGARRFSVAIAWENSLKETHQNEVRKSDVSILLSKLKACSIARDLYRGKKLHAYAIENELELNVYVASSLINMYAKCGSIYEARSIFERMPVRDTISWNALLTGYVENGQGTLALSLLNRMYSEGFEPTSLTFVAALKACVCIALQEEGVIIDGKLVKTDVLRTGHDIHSQVKHWRAHSDIKVCNMLVDMYAKCGSISEAYAVFQRIPCHNVVSWTVLMLGYVENAEEALALEAFARMPGDRDGHSYLAALRACQGLSEGTVTKIELLERTFVIHSEAECSGFCNDIFVGNLLVDLYGKCGSMCDARMAFDRMPAHDVVSWTALVLGYAVNGEPELSMEVFESMKRTRCEPNVLTYVAVIKAITSLAGERELLEKAMEAHSEVARHGYDSEMVVANTLVSMYSSCGSMVDAQRAFEKAPRTDSVMWAALVLGYVENAEYERALYVFTTMRFIPFPPENRTFAAALKASGALARVELVRSLHCEVCRYFCTGDDDVLDTSLVDSYGKCGSMRVSRHLFDCVPSTDCVMWTSLVSGYGRQGDTENVFRVYDSIREERVGLTSATYMCVLTACSHAGLVSKGKEIFCHMKSQSGVQPGIEHYICMVDLLGRANEIQGAVEIVRNMPFKPNVMTWMVLLAACHKWKNVDVGRLAFQSLIEMGENDTAFYNLMSNIYSTAESNQTTHARTRSHTHTHSTTYDECGGRKACFLVSGRDG